MRFHMVGLAYVPTNADHPYCAFTHRILRLAQMLHGILGHEVIFYGLEGSQVDCSDFIQLATLEEHKQWYGHIDPLHDILPCDTQSPAYHEFMRRALDEMKARVKEGDIVLAMVGLYHRPCAEPFVGQNPVVEPGIGYGYPWAPYKVFETYAWMHYNYALLGYEDGQWFDAVIPPAFDPKDFEYSEVKGDYMLFMARLINRKGIMIALELSNALGVDLVVAGQGKLVEPAENLNINPADYPHVRFLQRAVVGKERASLLANAYCFLAPTIYIEPNGNVAVEAAMSGTPVITTDWGGFTDNVLHGITGWRCRTFDDFCWAVKHAGEISPRACREWAVQNYSVHAVAPKYEEYFQKVLQSFYSSEGWYYRTVDRPPLGWLTKHYPCVTHIKHPEQPVEIELTGRFKGWFFPGSFPCAMTSW